MISKLAVAFALVLSVSVQFGHGNGVACPAIFAPVCGNDGKTYDNKCLLEHAAKSDATLKIEHYGRCEDGHPACTLEYYPICASDGITYGNECLFKYAKLADSSLTIVKFGVCDSLPRSNLALICGSDGKIYKSVNSFLAAQEVNPDLEEVDIKVCLDRLVPHIPIPPIGSNITRPVEPIDPPKKEIS